MKPCVCYVGYVRYRYVASYPGKVITSYVQRTCNVHVTDVTDITYVTDVTAVRPVHGLGMGSLTIGGCQRQKRIYKRYSSVAIGPDKLHKLRALRWYGNGGMPWR